MADPWDMFPDANGGTATLDWDAFPDAEPDKPSSQLGEARAQLRDLPGPGLLTGALGWKGAAAALEGLGTDIIGTAARFNARNPGAMGVRLAEQAGILQPGTSERMFAPNEQIADDLHRTGAAFEQAAAEQDAPGLPGMVQKGARNLIRSMPPAIVAARGGPYAAIAPAVVTTYSNALTEGKDAGLEGPALERYALTQASTEGLVAAAFQKIGLGGQEKLLAQTAISKGVGNAVRDYLKQTAGELGEESTIALGQAISRYAEGVDPQALDPERLASEAGQLAVTTLMGTSAAASPQIAGAAMEQAGRPARMQAAQDERLRATTARAERQEIDRNDFFTPQGQDAAKAWLRTQGTLDSTAALDSISRDKWQQLGLPANAGRSAADRKAFLDSLKAPPAPSETTALAETVEDIPRPEEPASATEERLDPATRINALLSQGPVSISDGKWTYQVIGLLDDKVRTKGGKLLPLSKVASGEYSVKPLAPAPSGPPKPATPVPMDPTVTDTGIAPPDIPEQAPNVVPPVVREAIGSLPPWIARDVRVEVGTFAPEIEGEGTRYDQRGNRIIVENRDITADEADHAAHEATVAYLDDNDEAIRPFVAEWAKLRYSHMPDKAAKVMAGGVTADQFVADNLATELRARLAGRDVTYGSQDTNAAVRAALIDKFIASEGQLDANPSPVPPLPSEPPTNPASSEAIASGQTPADSEAAGVEATFDEFAATHKYTVEKQPDGTYKGVVTGPGGFRYVPQANDKQGAKREAFAASQGQLEAALTVMDARGPAPTGLHVPVSFAENAPPISEHDIIATLSQDFGVPIRKGRMAKPKSVAGIYKVRAEVVRTRGRFAGDLAVVSHEVAHHIDKGQGNVSQVLGKLDPALKEELGKLDYDQTKKRDFEGFAEYVRLLWTTDDAAQYAPKFHDWFGKYLDARPELKEKFDRAKRLITQWRDQGAASRMRSQRQQRGWRPQPAGQSAWEQIKAGARSLRDRLTYELADRFNVLHKIDSEVLGAGWDTKGDATAGQLAAAYNLATAAHAERALFDGIHTVSKNHRVLGKGLRDAFTPLEAGEYEDWADYHLARHVVDVEQQTRPNPLAESKYNPGIRYDDARYVMDSVRADPDKHARFEEVSKALTQINNDRIEMLVDAGVLSRDDADKMLSKWGQTYTSLRRVKPTDMVSRLASSVLEIKQPVRKRSEEGSALPVMDPVEATILNLMEAYDSALKQQVMVKLAEETIPEYGGVEGMGEYVELVPANRKAATGTVEEILKSLKEAGFDPDLLKEIAIVAKLRRGESVSKPSLEWIADRYGVDPTTEFAIDDILDKTDGVPDAETAIALWRPDYSPNKNEKIIRLVYRGQPRMIQLAPELYSALQGMNPIQIHPMLRILQGMTRLTKLGATSLNAAFAAPNLVADYLAFQTQTKHTSGAESFYQPLVAALWNARAEIPQIAGEAVGTVSPQLGEKLKRGIEFSLQHVAGKTHPVVDLWHEFGGKIATRLGADKTTLRNVRGDVTGQHGVSIMERGSRAIDALRDTIGLFEAGPRIAEFMGYLKEHGYTIKNGKLVDANGNAARPSRGVLIGATLAARDVTTDFTRSGRAGRFADQFLAFFNAAVQSNIKFGKTLYETATLKKNWKQRAIAMSAMASAALLYALFRSDDDDYREQPDWLKRRYWTFGQDGQTWYRIRKPHDWAIISNVIEQFVSMWKDKDPESLATFVTDELHARNPVDPTSVSGMPFVEAGANYSFFRRGPIENARMQDVSPEHRAYPWTSPAAKFIGYYTGKTFGWGPAKIDYVLNETSGGLWGRTAGAESLESAAQKWSGGSAFTINRDYPEAVEEFYDRLSEATQKAASAKFKGQPDPAADAQAAKLNRYAELMKEIRTPVNQEADRAKRFEHEKYIVGLARHVMGREELDAYPNPLMRTDMPEAVQSAVDDYLGSLLMTAAEGPYQRQTGQDEATFAAKQQERDTAIQTALETLKEAGVDRNRATDLLVRAARKRGYGGEAIGQRRGRISGKL